MVNETSKKIEQTGDRTLIVTLVNGIKHGEICLKNQGKKELEGNYENGLLHGNKVSFSPSGKVTSVIPYYKGRPLRYGTMTI